MTALRRHRQSGFVFLTAVLILGIVAAALFAMAETASTEARATGSRATRAQLSQLLLAGAADTAARFQAAAPSAGQTWNVALPAQLEAATLAGTVEAIDAASAKARIVATIGREHLSQVIQLQRNEKGWRIISASLESS